MRRSVAVLAGGLGTRVAHLTGVDAPKPMLPIGDRPFADFKLAQLGASAEIQAWAKRIEALPYFDKTFPPHWK